MMLTWIKENFSIDKHLNHSQVDNIVRYWRKKHNATKESCINQHSLNNAGLPFLRAHLTLNLWINNAKKIIKNYFMVFRFPDNPYHIDQSSLY